MSMNLEEAIRGLIELNESQRGSMNLEEATRWLIELKEPRRQSMRVTEASSTSMSSSSLGEGHRASRRALILSRRPQCFINEAQ